MRKPILLAILFGLGILSQMSVVAQPISELRSDWHAPADTRDFPGLIIRPEISPADTSWVSFEVHFQSEVKLYIHNITTYETRELKSPVENSDFEDDWLGVTPVNRELAWRPTPARNGKIWAAFIGNASGNLELYLYNVDDDKYFIMRSWNDSTGIGTKQQPSWSPDGRCLTYTTTLAGSADIYIIRAMDWVMKDPLHPNIAFNHIPIIEDEGEQFGAVWSPTPGAGYIAYNHIGKDNTLAEIRIFDLRNQQQYGIVSKEPGRGFFAPSWDPSGTRIAFFSYGSSAGSFSKNLEPPGDKYGLGLASIIIHGDSLIVEQKRGGRSASQATIVDVSPNLDPLRSPAWLPDGKSLIVSLYDEKGKNPLRTVYPKDWEFGLSRQEWMAPPVGGDFDYPRDISLVNHSITFTFQQSQKRVLLVGQIAHQDSYSFPLASLELSKSRLSWWDDFSRNKKPGIFQKVGRFLWSPIAGPDIFVNKWFVPITAAMVGVGVAVGGGGDEPVVLRDWRTPGFPSAKLSRGVVVKIGF